MEASGALIFSVDRAWRYTSFNQAHAAAMRRSFGAEIALGRSILDCIPVEAERERTRRST